MQKISSYLYPNRIVVVADVTLFPVRWSIVYQNRIKLYQGVDNVLTLDVKNSDQKRIDISEMTLKMIVTDVFGRELLTADVTPSVTTGLATVNISQSDLTNITPQFLNFSIYRENEDLSKTVLYADTQFGAVGKMELVDTVMPKLTPPRYITRFAPITNTYDNPYTTIFYSDAVEVRKPNFLQAEVDETVELTVANAGLSGTVTIQYTTEDVVSTGTTWSDMETFSIVPSTASLSKVYTYPDYNREISWMRIKYERATDNTGNLDKVTVIL
jgi:hypothetical protein